MRAHLVLRSGNKKTGPIPVSTTEFASCPPSCALRDAGCYAQHGYTWYNWRGVDKGDRGATWDDFCRQIEALEPGQLWRHNVAGDLPGRGDRITPTMFRRLVAANSGKHGFTFTHKYTTTADRDLIKWANEQGFTVNLSGEGLAAADELYDYGIGPVAALVPADAPEKMRTPKGRHVVVCPAMTDAHLSCARCRLCAVHTRKAIVAFRAHGFMGKAVDAWIRGRDPVATHENCRVARTVSSNARPAASTASEALPQQRRLASTAVP